MHIITKSRLIESLLFLILSIVVIFIFRNIIIIPIVVIASKTLAFLYSLKNANISDFSKSKIRIKYLKHFIRNSIPLGFSILFIVIYYNLSMVILKLFYGYEEVGIFNAAFKIFLVLVVPFQIIFNSYYPRLIYLYESDSSNLKRELKKYSIFVAVTALIISVSLYFLSELVINLIYGEKFIYSHSVLKILAVAILFVGFNVSLGNPLIAFGKFKNYSAITGIGALLNLILCFLVIPIYGYKGAAFNYLFTEFILLFIFGLNFSILYKKIKFS